ncbi:phosphoribosylformylglycinamidine cyclo-ligase [Thermoanaerobacterium saccharolyticum]|uniref:phosphoribosylformylglycinamidine cyclo-ligase n=1 Tax=Thermoanaerobacterium saccharolyticum TaxID=28896 RepID=UPI002FD8D6DD
MDYKDAGVNIDEGNRFVEMIKPIAKSTIKSGVLNGIGGFGALYELTNYKNPVLVSGTDGVGTKLKIAFMMKEYDTIGVDLVAMCVNDIIVSGAKPLFFLDYFATGKLQIDVGVEVIKGIAAGCSEAECALIGGETAELPGMYNEGEFDIAGFAVGAVEKDEIIDGRNIEVGDVIIGLASSGIHSNGYSLVRKVLFDVGKMSTDDYIEEYGLSLGEVILKPTRIYVKAFKSLKGINIKGMAHITGGGFVDNIPRTLKDGVSARIDKKSWDVPHIFSLIKDIGNIDDMEMYRTFNMGIGMIIIVPNHQCDDAVSRLKAAGEKPFIIGEIVNGEKEVLL